MSRLIQSFSRRLSQEATKKPIRISIPGQFRESISNEHPVYKPEPNRYVLYFAHMCPFAHRTLLARAVKKLDKIIPIVAVHSVNDSEKGWRFDPKLGEDPIMKATHLRELYLKSQPDYDGRITVPVLFDSKTGTVVSNESADIVHMFNTGFNSILGAKTVNLYPANLADRISKELMPWLVEEIIFGTFRVGASKTQEEYETRARNFFTALDKFETILSKQPFLAGNVLTAADINIFPWIARLAPAYECLCKLNLKSLRHDGDYPNISKWLRKIYQLPGVAETMDMDQVVEGYFLSMAKINPSKLVPLYRGPDLTRPPFPLRDADFAWFKEKMSKL